MNVSRLQACLEITNKLCYILVWRKLLRGKTVENKNRILWIDVAKGICMISVIAGHLGVTEINKIVFSYHLTVFFILSGYTLKNNLTVETLSKKFKKLMLPYFVTCIAITLMDVFNSIFLKGISDFVSITALIAYDLRRSFFASGSVTTFGNIEVGGRIGAIWYLPATFFAILVAQLLLKYVADRKARYAMAIPLALISCISGGSSGCPSVFSLPFWLLL